MKLIYSLPILSLILLSSTNVNAAGSMLRVGCEGIEVGSEVLINGKFKGECPIDIAVPEGTLKLLVRGKNGKEKPVEKYWPSRYLKGYEQEIRIGEATVKKIEVHLLFGIAQEDAAAGDAKAMADLANCYQEGRGAPIDLELGLNWALKSAETGNTDGMIAAGEIYAAKKNDVEALRWYRRSAELGYHVGMFYTGVAYIYGKGVSEDLVEGVAWYRKAADAGNGNGMFELAKSYATGRGVASSEEQAIFWWRKCLELDPKWSQPAEELKKRGAL